MQWPCENQLEGVVVTAVGYSGHMRTSWREQWSHQNQFEGAVVT